MKVPWEINVLFLVYCFDVHLIYSLIEVCFGYVSKVCWILMLCVSAATIKFACLGNRTASELIQLLCQNLSALSLIDCVSMEIWHTLSNWWPSGYTRSIHRGRNIVILTQWFNLIVDMCSSSGLSSQGQDGPTRQKVFMQMQFALAIVASDQWKGTCATCCDRRPKEEMTWVRTHLNATYQDPTANRQWLSKQGYQSCEMGRGRYRHKIQ